MSYKRGWFKSCLPTTQQIYKQFCSLLLPFQSNYFWLFTITHVLAVAVRTCYSLKKSWTCGWVSGEPRHCLSRVNIRFQGTHRRATTTEGKLSVQNTTMFPTVPHPGLPLNWLEEGSHTWPWACNSHENPKTEPLANRSQHDTDSGTVVGFSIQSTGVSQTECWMNFCSRNRGLGAYFVKNCYKSNISLKSCSSFILIIHANFTFYSVIHVYHFK